MPKKKFMNSLVLDQESVGQSLIITNNLTEVYKVNNLYHFNLDYQKPHRVNLIKLLFDEKSKKQSSFKMRINISVPEKWQEKVDGATKMRVIYSETIDENLVQHINQLAFKKSSLKYFKESS